MNNHFRLFFTTTIFIFMFMFSLQGQATLPLPHEKWPTSIADIECGHYLIGAQLKVHENGEDFFHFFPESDREFSVPAKELTAADSLKFNNVMGFFEVSYPLKNNQKQGRFYFKKWVASATQEEINKTPLKKLSSSCEIIKQ
jgi:hypothetical protein